MPIKINGATSGSTTITAPASGGDETIELSTALAGKLPIAGGKILQIVRATDSTNRTTTSTSFVDVTGMSVTITPQKNDSAILLIVSGVALSSINAAAGELSNFQITDSSNNAISGAEEQFLGAGNFARSNSGIALGFRIPLLIVGYATPATTSPVTYKLRFKSNSSANTTTSLNNNIGTGQMYAIEVSA